MKDGERRFEKRGGQVWDDSAPGPPEPLKVMPDPPRAAELVHSPLWEELDATYDALESLVRTVREWDSDDEPRTVTMALIDASAILEAGAQVSDGPSS